MTDFGSSDEGADTGNGSGGDCSALSAPDRQSGEGNIEPPTVAADPSPNLPDDLIDRAVEVMDWICNCDREDLDLHLAVRRVAPLLIEHGRRLAFTEAQEQERTRWETRIERQAAFENLAKTERDRVARWHEESGTKVASELRADAYRHDYAERVLRSLLTGEGENGE